MRSMTARARLGTRSSGLACLCDEFTLPRTDGCVVLRRLADFSARIVWSIQEAVYGRKGMGYHLHSAYRREGMSYPLHSRICGLRSHSALDIFPVDDFDPVFGVENGSRNGTGRDGTGVNIGLSTIGFDKSCIAYSAAYTFAY